MPVKYDVSLMFVVATVVADVIKSFGTVDRSILDRVLSSLGLPGWFRHAYFEYYAHVRLQFKLASGLGEPWSRHGCIPQGCPLSMMFIVALYFSWCRYLELHGVFADTLKCVCAGILVCFCALRGLQLGMSGWLARSRLPVSVSC